MTYMMKIHHDEYFKLSRSTYLMGSQCPKRLWLNRKRPELIPDKAATMKMVFDRGKEIGLLARALFPGGKDAAIDHPALYVEAINKTYEWIDGGEAIIYEAAFSHDEVMTAVDILLRSENKWYAYEVNGSSSVKDHHLTDTAFQYNVITNAGLELEDIFIIHLDKKYVRQGPLDSKALFKIVSVKQEVLKLQPTVAENIKEFKDILHQPVAPMKDIGIHCSQPHDCEFRDHCWDHIPAVSVFDLTKLKASKKFDLYYEGILEFHQLPSGYTLTYAQDLQIKAHLENYIHSEPQKIKDWLLQLSYPLYFMDFETFNPPLPMYNGSRPFQHIPFQFSVHVQNEQGGPLTHFEFLGSPETDPRPDFMKQLVAATQGEGTILVYSSFEMSRLRELKDDLPEWTPHINAITNRIVDLMMPFVNKWHYHAAMNGSHSIKEVLTALEPDLNYKHLEIANGSAAMAAFESLLKVTNVEVKKDIRQALLEYCKMDTWAMVKVLERLKEFGRQAIDELI